MTAVVHSRHQDPKIPILDCSLTLQRRGQSPGTVSESYSSSVTWIKNLYQDFGAYFPDFWDESASWAGHQNLNVLLSVTHKDVSDLKSKTIQGLWTSLCLHTLKNSEKLPNLKDKHSGCLKFAERVYRLECSENSLCAR